MRKTKMLALAILAAALTAMPLSASATTASPAKPVPPAAFDAGTVEAPPIALAPDWPTTWPGTCRHAWIYINRETGIFERPDANSPVIGSTNGPQWWHCRWHQVGGRYNGCGGTNANGWVLIPMEPRPRQGWVISTCTEDPVLN